MKSPVFLYISNIFDVICDVTLVNSPVAKLYEVTWYLSVTSDL